MKIVVAVLLVVLFAAPVLADVVDDYKIRNDPGCSWPSGLPFC